MKAIVSTKYGSPDVLELKEVAKPTPKEAEVLVKIYAAAVNAADWRWLRGDPLVGRFMYGLLTPKNPILGADIAGRVEAVGKNVTAFQPGDAVFGDLSACGFGGFADYVCARADALALKPDNITFEQAAAVPMAAVTALQGLRTTGKIQPGHVLPRSARTGDAPARFACGQGMKRVLVNGASGGVGTFAVQIAKSFGAEVTAVVSTRNVAQAHSLGADHVIDYTQEDFTLNGQQYDLILAANGYQSISAYKRALSPTGMYVMTGGSNAQMFQAMLLGPWLFRSGDQKMGNGGAGPNQKDLAYLRDLLAAGKVVPVIDRCYPLSQVPDAIRYVEEGHARGKVIITIAQN